MVKNTDSEAMLAGFKFLHYYTAVNNSKIKYLMHAGNVSFPSLTNSSIN